MGVRQGRVVGDGAGRGRGKARTELRISDGSGYLRITFFNQPWRARQFPEGSEAMFFGKVTEYRGQKQLANPEVDLLDEEDRLQITALYPQSDKLRLYSKDFRGWQSESLRRSQELVEPLPTWLLDQHDFVDRTAAFHGIHVPETMAEAEAARRRLVFDELLRIQLALVLRKRRIEATSQGIEHDTSGELVQRFLDRAAVRAHRRPAHRDRRDHGRPRPADPDAPAAPGRRGCGQDGRRRRRAADGGAGRPPGRVHGAHRGAGRSALLDDPAAPRGHLRARRRRVAVRRATAHGRAAHQQGHRQGAPAGARGARRRGGRPAGRHARADPGGGRVPQPRCRRHRRAAPLRRGAARRPARQGRRRCGARRAGHDGHADPAHRRHDRLRRPRRVGPRREADRPEAHRHHVGQGRRRGGRRVGEGARGGGRGTPGLRRVPADRREREARGGVGRGDLRPPRGRRALRPRARACSTAGCRPPRRRRR